jgi:hypothetical protein
VLVVVLQVAPWGQSLFWAHSTQLPELQTWPFAQSLPV